MKRIIFSIITALLFSGCQNVTSKQEKEETLSQYSSSGVYISMPCDFCAVFNYIDSIFDFPEECLYIGDVDYYADSCCVYDPGVEGHELYFSMDEMPAHKVLKIKYETMLVKIDAETSKNKLHIDSMIFIIPCATDEYFYFIKCSDMTFVFNDGVNCRPTSGKIVSGFFYDYRLSASSMANNNQGLMPKDLYVVNKEIYISSQNVSIRTKELKANKDEVTITELQPYMSDFKLQYRIKSVEKRTYSKNKKIETNYYDIAGKDDFIFKGRGYAIYKTEYIDMPESDGSDYIVVFEKSKGCGEGTALILHGSDISVGGLSYFGSYGFSGCNSSFTLYKGTTNVNRRNIEVNLPELSYEAVDDNDNYKNKSYRIVSYLKDCKDFRNIEIDKSKCVFLDIELSKERLKYIKDNYLYQ